MTAIEFYDTAPDGEVYDPAMFAGKVGQRVPVRVRPSGKRIGTATLLAAEVDDDGQGVTCTVQLPGDNAAVKLLRAEHPGFSFTMRDPDELAIVKTAFRDPLAAEPPKVTYRGLG